MKLTCTAEADITAVIWSAVECGIGTLCACLPTYRPLFLYFTCCMDRRRSYNPQPDASPKYSLPLRGTMTPDEPSRQQTSLHSFKRLENKSLPKYCVKSWISQRDKDDSIAITVPNNVIHVTSSVQQTRTSNFSIN